jgi:fibronectin type 3 domain-containing protein
MFLSEPGAFASAFVSVRVDMRSGTRWKLLALTVAIVVGCGGSDNIQSLIDLKAPQTVKNTNAFPSDRKVRVTWTPNTEPALVGYNIYRSTASQQGFTLVGSTGISQSPFFEDPGPDLNGDGIPDGLVNNIRYFYKVTAFDRNGRESTFDLAAVTNAIPGALPAGTQDLEVRNLRGYGGNGRAIITWDLNISSLVFGYNVYRNQQGTSSQFTLVALVPQGINSFSDASLSNNTEFIYQVAPVTRELAEGRRSQTRPIRVTEGDTTFPKPPGSDRANGPVTAVQTPNGILISWGRPTQNTDGSVIGQNNLPNDLVGGGFIIKRGRSFEGEFRPVGILENVGSEIGFSYLDPFGTAGDFYLITVFDVTGNESSPSDIVSVNNFVPNMPQGVDAFASSSVGNIVVTWNANAGAVDGYRVYRSTNRDSGYQDISGLLPNTVTTFTDADGSLQIGETYFYKVQAEAAGRRGALSPPAAATPGPSSGIFYLEAEDATATVNDALHFSALTRQGFHDPFSGNGVLFIQASNNAIPNVSFVQLDWSQDIDATRSITPIVRTYDTFLISIRNSSSGIFGIAFGELLAATVQPPFTCPPLQITSKDFFKSVFGFPPTPTVERVGSICFADASSFPPNGPNENLRMTLTYQGFNPAVAQGVGEVFIDAVVLLRR